MVRALASVRTWGEMIKFEHSVFALPFALLATFLAARPGLPAWGQLGLIVVCMVAARSAAMGFNRLADRANDNCDSPPPADQIRRRLKRWRSSLVGP